MKRHAFGFLLVSTFFYKDKSIKKSFKGLTNYVFTLINLINQI